MNVCFELKLAVQVLRQRAAAGRRAGTDRGPQREHVFGGHGGEEGQEGRKCSKVWWERYGREKLQDKWVIKPSYLAGISLLCYSLAVLTFYSASSLHSGWGFLLILIRQYWCQYNAVNHHNSNYSNVTMTGSSKIKYFCICKHTLYIFASFMHSFNAE